MAIVGEYNPLDYGNLTKNCVQELMTRGPYMLPPAAEFDGAGVYALFYTGPLEQYRKVRSPEAQWPIYVGKAVPPGARKGAKGKGKKAGRKAAPEKSLYGRLAEHAKSISAASSTLSLDDFLVRYLVVTPLWITMAERFLIEHYQPVWNVCIEGFGNHDPGKGRYEGMITWWDVLHPGREWALKCKQGRTQQEALDRLAKFMASYEPHPGDVLSTPGTPKVELEESAESDDSADDDGEGV